MNVLSTKDRAMILTLLVEGNGVNATARITGKSNNTVLKLLAEAGAACAAYHDRAVRNLKSERMQADEIWAFVGMKERNVPKEQRGAGLGDVWTWTALDPDSKLIVSFLVGQRSRACAEAFTADLASRLANKIQLTTDGYRPYVNAVEKAFGGDIDFAMLKKLYSNPVGNSQERRYSSGHCCGTIQGTVCGNPDDKHVSTSYVERQNLTMRMHMRRFTRLTNSFSKKIENHENAVSLHFMFYNFCKIHTTLKVTPAMAAGIDDHVWSMDEVVMMMDTMPKQICNQEN